MSTAKSSAAMIFFEWLLVVVLAVLVFSGFYIHGPFLSGRLESAELLHTAANYLILALLVVKVYLMALGINQGFRKAGKWANRGVLLGLIIVLVPEFALSVSLFTGARPFAELFRSALGGLSGVYMLHYFLLWLLFSALSVYIYFSLVELLPRFGNTDTGDVVEPSYRK